jgi:hypothetical protein
MDEHRQGSGREVRGKRLEQKSRGAHKVQGIDDRMEVEERFEGFG